MKYRYFILFAVFFVLFNTQIGLRTAIYTLTCFLPGKLHVEKVEGSLLNMRLSCLSYHSKNKDISATSFQLKCNILSGSMRLFQYLHLKDVKIYMKESSDQNNVNYRRIPKYTHALLIFQNLCQEVSLDHCSLFWNKQEYITVDGHLGLKWNLKWEGYMPHMPFLSYHINTKCQGQILNKKNNSLSITAQIPHAHFYFIPHHQKVLDMYDCSLQADLDWSFLALNLKTYNVHIAHFYSPKLGAFQDVDLKMNAVKAKQNLQLTWKDQALSIVLERVKDFASMHVRGEHIMINPPESENAYIVSPTYVMVDFYQDHIVVHGDIDIENVETKPLQILLLDDVVKENTIFPIDYQLNLHFNQCNLAIDDLKACVDGKIKLEQRRQDEKMNIDGVLYIKHGHYQFFSNKLLLKDNSQLIFFDTLDNPKLELYANKDFWLVENIMNEDSIFFEKIPIHLNIQGFLKAPQVLLLSHIQEKIKILDMLTFSDMQTFSMGLLRYMFSNILPWGVNNTLVDLVVNKGIFVIYKSRPIAHVSDKDIRIFFTPSSPLLISSNISYRGISCGVEFKTEWY